MKSADEESGVVRRRELGEERKPATHFYSKREHEGPPGAASHLPRSARREPEKDNAAVEKGGSRNAACLLLSTWSQLGPPDAHTAAPRSLLPSDTAQKAYGRPSPSPRGEQTWPLEAHIS